MDRLLTLAFVSEHDGQYIETINNQGKSIIKSGDHMMLIKKEEDGIVLTTEAYDKETVFIRKYYPNGTPLIHGQAINGKKHGSFCEYYPSGKLAATYSFLHGNLHGTETAYEETGNIIYEICYSHGICQWKKEYKDRSLKYCCFYEDGDCIKIQEYSPSGKLLTESQIKDGKLHGEAKEYHENGFCKRLTFHHMGVLHGSETCYGMTGKIHRTGTYYMGKKHGEFKYYNSFGNVTHIEVYNHDVKI